MILRNIWFSGKRRWRIIISLTLCQGNNISQKRVQHFFKNQGLFPNCTQIFLNLTQMFFFILWTTLRWISSSSICSGLVAATFGTPADVVKTRIMNNPDLYRGSLDCFLKAVSYHLVKLCSLCYFQINPCVREKLRKGTPNYFVSEGIRNFLSCCYRYAKKDFFLCTKVSYPHGHAW